MEAFRVHQAAVVTVIVVATAWGCGPGRTAVLDRPRAALAAMLIADLVYMLWATVPFIPMGIDESYFAINAQRYRGHDLYNCWIRTPLPGLMGALTDFHPPLVGLVAKELAAVAVFAIARPGLGLGGALWAAWLTVTSSRLARYGAYYLNETYAAASVAGLVWAAAAGRSVWAALCAGLGFASRWQLLVLAPLAAWSGWQRGRLRAACLAVVVFALPALVTIPLTEVDPLRALEQNRGHAVGFVERLVGYLQPKVGFGLGVVSLALALVGVLEAWRRRQPGLRWSAAAFGVCTASVLAVGMVMPNYMTAAVPAGCVLVAAGCLRLAGMGRWGARRPLVVAAAVAVVVLHALPIDPPKARSERRARPQAAILADRAAFLTALGDAPLYSELEFLAVCAVLARPVHAVLGPGTDQPEGVSMDWEGRWAFCTRDQLQPGSTVLTREPGAHEVLWRAGTLALVRW
ncbi:MAG: hypothetical protein R3F56_02545 [Planctomycetota bacterium]